VLRDIEGEGEERDSGREEGRGGRCGKNQRRTRAVVVTSVVCERGLQRGLWTSNAMCVCVLGGGCGLRGRVGA
jgi:hypothetical protein